MSGPSRSLRGRTLLVLIAAFQAAILVASFLAPPASVAAAGALRSAASDTTPGASGDNSVVISKPTGTSQNDVMVAAIAEKTNGSITPPSGWTLIGSKLDNAQTTANSLAVYYRVAGASEGVTYTWSLPNNAGGGAGCILTFTGIDPTFPISANAGQSTASGF